MGFFSKDIGIDLGTASVLVYIKGEQYSFFLAQESPFSGYFFCFTFGCWARETSSYCLYWEGCWDIAQ